MISTTKRRNSLKAIQQGESENKLTVRLPHANYCTISFSYSGATPWNSHNNN